MYDSNKVGGRVMIGADQQFVTIFIFHIVSLFHWRSWLSRIIWQWDDFFCCNLTNQKFISLPLSPIWDSHHPSHPDKHLSAPPLQIQTHKGGWDFSRSTKMQKRCFGVEFSFEQWRGAVSTGFLFPGRPHRLPWVHDCPLHHVQRVARWGHHQDASF